MQVSTPVLSKEQLDEQPLSVRENKSVKQVGDGVAKNSLWARWNQGHWVMLALGTKRKCKKMERFEKGTCQPRSSLTKRSCRFSWVVSIPYEWTNIFGPRCPYTTSGWFVLHVTSETIKPSPALSFYAQSRVRQLQHEAMKRVQLDGFDSRRFRDTTNVTTRQPSQEQHLLESSCNAQAPILRQGFMCPEKISLKCLFHFMAMVWSWHGGRMALGTYPIAEFDSSWVTFSCQELKCGKNDRGNLEILLVFWVATSLKDIWPFYMIRHVLTTFWARPYS